MERIAVIGCGGSGKTTLSNQLGGRLNLPVLHIDGFYRRLVPGIGRVQLKPEEWETVHRSLLTRRRWVIDGMKLGTLSPRLEAADTVVFLDLPTWECLWSVVWRRVRSSKSVRPELGTFNVGLSREFLGWIWNFRRIQRPMIVALLASCSCDVVVLHGRREIVRFAASFPDAPERLAA